MNQSIIITPLSQDDTATPIIIDKNHDIDFPEQSSEDENKHFQDEFLNSSEDEVLEVKE